MQHVPRAASDIALAHGVKIRRNLASRLGLPDGALRLRVAMGNDQEVVEQDNEKMRESWGCQ